LLSLSQAIEARKQAYYDALSQAQRSNEITAWVTYFAGTVLTAQTDAEEAIGFTLKKTKFFNRYNGVSKATATRDLQELLKLGAIHLSGDAGGRSTKYQVNL